MAELEQLALDPQVSPARVLPRHPHHQGGEDVVDRWPSGPVGVGPSSADEAAMPAQDRVRGDQAMGHAVLGAAAGRARRTRPGPPSPGVVVGWCGAGRRPRGAARGARCPWRRTCGPAVGPARAPAGRSSTATAATRRDHVRPAITAGQRPRPDFWHPTCVLKWSDDDVEDRQHEACSTSDGGRPSGFAVQAEIPNHRKLRRLRAGVVSVAAKVPRVAGQVGDEKANVCEPLLTHRNKERWHRNRTVWGGPGQRRALRGASSTGERPACGPGGARCIGGASSSQALVGNRRTCRSDSDGRDWTRLAYRSREGEPQAVMAVSGRVPMRGTGADRFVVAMKAL